MFLARLFILLISQIQQMKNTAIKKGIKVMILLIPFAKQGTYTDTVGL